MRNFRFVAHTIELVVCSALVAVNLVAHDLNALTCPACSRPRYMHVLYAL